MFSDVRKLSYNNNEHDTLVTCTLVDTSYMDTQLCGIVRWVWAADAVGGAMQEATQIWNKLPACILARLRTKNRLACRGD